ncbi:GntR family transcriptional regulator [Acidaminobacter sp. JC074]|uniref:GntR family transcriptional regulator n=1 Tax=Acidaminobacter sp. JC074 TaxID=2530199 RepID=UPI001F0E0B9A|nr:GntR family transcriptional regulator [Acidaminobacter sp. JC074]MCH4887817.1 GntR family transcriptional regulator [Acidaminobacter sp. JC074]
MYLKIDRDSKVSLKKQIYSQIKTMILNGILKPDTKLIASRKLAEDLKVSRNSVIEAYDMLCSEGYARSVVGSGVYVNVWVKFDRQQMKESDINLEDAEDFGYDISFRPGLPSLEHFPEHKWL